MPDAATAPANPATGDFIMSIDLAAIVLPTR